MLCRPVGHFSPKKQADGMKVIGDEIIIPYWNKLMPKSIRLEGSLVATDDNDD